MHTATNLPQEYDARFGLDQHGDLKQRLELDLGDEGIANVSHAHGNEHWGFGDEGRMRRRDESTNDYYIDASGRCFCWER